MSAASEDSVVRRRPVWLRRVAWSLGMLGVVVAFSALWGEGPAAVAEAGPGKDQAEEGREIFRYDTFGDEQQWTDRLRMHEVIESSLDPLTALGLGLKVDVEALPEEVLNAIAAGTVDLTDPATTLELIRL